MARTEEQKVSRAPIVVIFGGTEYKVNILPMSGSRAWREEFAKATYDLPKHALASADKPNEFKDAIQALLVSNPDAVIDLFFLYAKDLDRKEIMDIGTDEEMNEAFNQVAKTAFPLAKSLADAMATLGQ